VLTINTLDKTILNGYNNYKGMLYRSSGGSSGTNGYFLKICLMICIIALGTSSNITAVKTVIKITMFNILHILYLL